MTVRAESEITLARVDDGNDGVSPVANVVKVGDTATITITDSGGTTTASISDGSSGPTITDVKTQYYLSTSDSSATGGSWSDTPQAFISGYYYWTREYTTYSDSSHTTSTPVYNRGLTYACEYAESASDAAEAASGYAQNAYNTASQAIDQLSVVENIVGVLDLISQNGTYSVTPDTSPQTDKWYFTRSGSGTQGDPYIYTVVVPDPTDDPNALGYYELVSIDQSIQNYVSSHLALTNDGLNLQNGPTRLLLSTTDGLVLYDQNGSQVAKYGTNTIIGDENGFHVKITNSRLSFYRDGVNEVAYISGDKLYITQSVVLQQMDVGTPVSDGGLGQWSWKVHEVNGQNNLYLKWLG